MREQKVLPKEFEFYFPDIDNLVLVQCEEDGSVTIRSTKDNISEKRKMFFIHELAAEGFIPDHYQWFSGSTMGSMSVHWIKDCSWVKIPEKVTRRSNHFMSLLLAGACLFWVAMMRVVIVSNVPHPTASSGRVPCTLACSVRAESLVETAVRDHLLPDNR